MAKKKVIPYHVGFSYIEQKLMDARLAYIAGDVANAAGYAYQLAKLALDLSDEIRYEHGVKAGLNRAAAAKERRGTTTKKRKRKTS